MRFNQTKIEEQIQRADKRLADLSIDRKKVREEQKDIKLRQDHERNVAVMNKQEEND